MPQQQDIDQLTQTLAQLNQYLTQLSNVLLVEQTALTDRDTQAIETLAEEKTQLTQHIEAAEQTRQSICTRLNIAPSKEAMAQWLRNKPKNTQQQISSHWKRITYLGQKCATQNQLNGILLAHQQHSTQNALAILRGSMSSQDEYSETGTHQSKQTTNIIGKV